MIWWFEPPEKHIVFLFWRGGGEEGHSGTWLSVFSEEKSFSGCVDSARICFMVRLRFFQIAKFEKDGVPRHSCFWKWMPGKWKVKQSHQQWAWIGKGKNMWFKKMFYRLRWIDDTNQEKAFSGDICITRWKLIQPAHRRSTMAHGESALKTFVLTWATAFIYDDEDRMWRQAGFVEMLVSPAKRDQNEMGVSKNEVGLKHFKTRLKRGHSWWKRGHSWWKSAETWKTRLKRGWGTPSIFFTAATSWIKAAAHMFHG